MNLWDHLGELRRRLLICIYCLLAGSVAGIWAVDPVMKWLARPIGVLVFVHPAEAFTAQVKIALGVSFIICLPVVIYQAWAFVAAGLEPGEKRYLRWAVPVSYVLFMGGLAFSAAVLFPKAIGFLVSLRSGHLEPMITVGSYLDFFLLLGLLCGLLFQLPLILHLMARLGMLRGDFLANNRRVYYLLIFVFATIFNMTPDVFSQVILAVIIIALFELSILLVRWEAKRRLPR